MKKLIKLSDVINENLKDEEFRIAFEEDDIFARLALQIAKERKKMGLTQKEIAKYFDTSQQAVSRLENKAKTAIELLKEKRSSLISSAVTGKIDVRN